MDLPDIPSSPSVNPETPWLGLQSFTEAEQYSFFGRDREIADLFDRVRYRPLTVLFGQSGLGKTSLLRAGLVPRLRQAGFIPVIMRLDHADVAPSLELQVLHTLQRALAPETFTVPNLHAPGTLWLLLHDPTYHLSRAISPRLVLILDQFEEIFTVGETTLERRHASTKFLAMLADLAENRVPYSVRETLEADESLAESIDYSAQSLRMLLSLREDFLHRLERCRSTMPSVMENRLELRLLSGNQALAAVLEPSRFLSRSQAARRPILEPETAAQIVRFVAAAPPDVPLSEVDVVPSLLSLLCAELNAHRLANSREVITFEHLAASSGDIFASFYERVLSDQPPVVRQIVEDELISPSGYRASVNEDTFLSRTAAAGLSVDDSHHLLHHLIGSRLLVAEEHSGVRCLELAHDVLTGVARRSREARQATQMKSAAESAVQLRRSNEMAEQRRQHLRAVGTRAMLLIVIAAVTLAVWALREMNLAKRQRQEAFDARDQARRAVETVSQEQHRAKLTP